MKKLFVIIIPIFLTTIISCKKENDITKPETFLIGITESLYLPYDSVTTQYQLDRKGMIVFERSSKYIAKRGYMDSELLNNMGSDLKYCKIFTYDSSERLIKITDIDHGGRKLPSSTDSLTYQNNRIVRRELKDYKLPTPLGTFIFAFPFWVTKLSFEHDASGKISIETDSVFISHDIAKNSVDVQKTSQKFAYKIVIKNEYNQKGELVKKTTESFKTIPLFYGNGSNVIDVTLAGKLVSGSTVYDYQYNSQNQLITKLEKFTDSKTRQVYNSVFKYSYGPD